MYACICHKVIDIHRLVANLFSNSLASSFPPTVSCATRPEARTWHCQTLDNNLATSESSGSEASRNAALEKFHQTSLLHFARSSYDLCWWSSMIFEKKKNMQNKETMQPLDKSEALRPEIFQKLYVSPMKVHGCSSGSHSIYKLFPLRSFHPAEKQLEKRSRSAGPCFAKSRNTGIYMLSCPWRMFYPP